MRSTPSMGGVHCLVKRVFMHTAVLGGQTINDECIHLSANVTREPSSTLHSQTAQVFASFVCIFCCCDWQNNSASNGCTSFWIHINKIPTTLLSSAESTSRKWHSFFLAFFCSHKRNPAHTILLRRYFLADENLSRKMLEEKWEIIVRLGQLLRFGPNTLAYLLLMWWRRRMTLSMRRKQWLTAQIMEQIMANDKNNRPNKLNVFIYVYISFGTRRPQRRRPMNAWSRWSQWALASLWWCATIYNILIPSIWWVMAIGMARMERTGERRREIVCTLRFATVQKCHAQQRSLSVSTRTECRSSAYRAFGRV